MQPYACLRRLDVTYFRTPADLRKWFRANHAKAAELWVGFYKKDSGKPSITWPESVDEALCVGWIDGIRKSLGPDSYTIRFTPRRNEQHLERRQHRARQGADRREADAARRA